MLAMTGVITATAKKQTFITLLQDMEYIHGQLFERSVESACGSVTCLPGALTILRFSAFRKMAKYYFADKAEQCDDLFDYGKCHLGEDRWLTHLFMIGAKERYQIQMCTGAFCKTEAVLSVQSLLKQRRRWFLGFITNEVCMLTDVRLWRRYPILCVVRFMQNTIRTTALLFFIMVLSIMTTTQKISQLPVGFIAVSLGLNWALMFYFGLRLKRFKAWLYPIMFIVNPFFNWVYMVYGIFTAGQRTWGGPRADAGAADANTTPQQAIEKAEAQGDDLAVIPETFRPAIEAQRKPEDGLRKRIGAGVLPEDRIEGRFTNESGPYGYTYPNDSIGTLPDHVPRNLNVPHVPLHPRDSFDSFVSYSSTSAGGSVYFPRRVESIMGEEDRRKYHVAQAGQTAAGGAFARDPADVVYGHHKAMSSVSTSSIDSAASNFQGYVTYNSQPGTPGEPNYASGSPTPGTPANGAHLALPDQAHTRPGNQPRSTSAARSPLARLSLVRTPGADVEEEVEQAAAASSSSTPQSMPSGSPPSEPSQLAAAPEPESSTDADEREGRSKTRKKLLKKSR
jgi:chitin synthase